MNVKFRISCAAGLTALAALFLSACCCGCITAGECTKTEAVPEQPVKKAEAPAEKAAAVKAESAKPKRERPAYESYRLKVTPAEKKNIYKTGEKICFNITLLDKAKQPVSGQKIGYAVSSGDGKLQKNIITTTGRQALVCEASLDKPAGFRSVLCS